MSIFSRLRDSIFGKAQAKPAPGAPGSAPMKPIGTQPMQPGQAKPGAATAPKPAPVLVDVEEVLEGLAAKSGEKLNWRTSIVDLMKLLDMDASLGERKELAQELGYKGELNGSAEMNIWLHKAVMQGLAKNGGKVPASMLD